MTKIIDKYIEQYISVKEMPDYAFGLAQKFVTVLLALPPAEKYELLPLFKQIENDAFENGIKIPNLNYENLVNEKNDWESVVHTKTKVNKIIKVKTEDDFNKVLFNFFSKYEDFFQKIKGYFVFKLDNVEEIETKVIVLYDESYNKHPEINFFDYDDVNLSIEKYELREFIELTDKQPEILNAKYLCILLIASNLRNNEIVVPYVDTLIGKFSNVNSISVKKIPLSAANDYDIRNISEGIEDIKIYADKVFNNRALSFEEEMIIKKLFDGNEMILDYKFLKSGNSGSKVIEIHPLRGNHPEMGRFVVKFGLKDTERKIKKEKSLFRQYVTDLLVPSYIAEFEETATHEGIRYNYASSDSKKDSFPFSKLVTEKINQRYDYPFSLNDVIDELFACAPYQKWATTFPVTQQVKTLYGDYLKSETKILKTIAIIKGVELSNISNDKLVSNYNIIKDLSISTFKKICHGDLHSENFFKDDKGVYLIDFGWTNQHHSLIDHATLECSLKFKHLPFYSPINELMSFEEEFLSIDSFSKSFSLSTINRKSILEISSLISQIRESAKEFMSDKANPLEYLISLFVISFRQIQYGDLNQMYAMHSAEILSDKIIELIKQ